MREGASPVEEVRGLHGGICRQRRAVRQQREALDRVRAAALPRHFPPGQQMQRKEIEEMRERGRRHEGEGVRATYRTSAAVECRSTSMRKKYAQGRGSASCSRHGSGMRASLRPVPPTGSLLPHV